MQIRPVGATLFHVDRRSDRQTDMTKVIVALCNFANAPNKIGGPTIGLYTIMVNRKSPASTGNQTLIFSPVTSCTETFILLL